MADIQSDMVAVIDDDHSVRESLKFLLETVGHKVATFASATAFLADRTFRPACMIVDNHMPQMTGLQLAELLRTEGANIPLLLMTGAPTPAIRSRAAELGIGTVLGKPFDEDDLLHFIRAHARTRLTQAYLTGGTPMASKLRLRKSDPIAVEIRRIVRSTRGRKAAIEATQSGMPALSGVDRLLREQLPDSYNRPDRGTVLAGAFVAELMHELGYEAGTRRKCEAGSLAQTGIFWIIRYDASVKISAGIRLDDQRGRRLIS